MRICNHVDKKLGPCNEQALPVADKQFVTDVCLKDRKQEGSTRSWVHPLVAKMNCYYHRKVVENLFNKDYGPKR